MNPIGWALYALAAAAAFAAVIVLYARREAPGQGRRVLTFLRWAAVALLLLLLFDPRLPEFGAGGGRDAPVVLLDHSLSMSMPMSAGDDRTRWAAAVAEARRLAGGDGVLLVGATPSRVPADALAGLAPEAPRARLLPALRLAAETGARRAVFITDGAIVDGADVRRDAADLGLGIELVKVTGDAPPPNLAISEVDAPAWVEAGSALEVRVTVSGRVGSADPLAVVVSEGGRERARAEVEVPEVEGSASTVLRFEAAPSGSGQVRYDVELRPADAVPDDDRRTIYVDVSERPAGVAVVSFRPDWEPRFLVPVLEQALGLPVRGYLRAGGRGYALVGTGLEAGRTVGEDRVRADVAAAELLVLHGLSSGAPTWAVDAARSAGRVLVMPAPDAEGDFGLPVPLPAPRAGEWYPASDLPLSPLSALLEGAALDGLPPVTRVRPVESTPAGSWAAMRGRLDARGAAVPLVLAAADRDRRWAVALADGYWQWSFRGGAAREAYRSLWGGLAGWLTEGGTVDASAAVRPARLSLPRAERVPWLVSGSSADSVRLVIEGASGEVAADTVLRVAGDTVFSRPLPPGHYRYVAERFPDAGADAGSGAFTVESYSPEFLRPSAELEPATAATAAVTAGGPRSPLHTRAWPFVLLALILSSEWVLRRRWGLR